MRERRRSDRRCTPARAASAGRLGPLASVARALRTRARSAGTARVWAPLVVRALALGIALLGIAGIGSVAARTPAPPGPAPGVSHAELGFGALSARALAIFASAGPPALVSEAAGAAEAGLCSAGPPCPERGSEPAGRARASEDAPVVLNRADAAELQRLPGVGVKRAEAILALRQRLGRFRRPSDLLRVKGIGRRTLERMLPHLVLD